METQALVFFSEVVAELLLGVVIVFLFKEKIWRWWTRLGEREHSRMLESIDLTQTIVEDDVLKVRTRQAKNLGTFTLGNDELTRVLHAAVQESYEERPFVVIPEEVSFQKLKTLAYSWANTALNEEATRERLKPADRRREIVSVEGLLVLYAEKDAEVSKVHLEMVPNSLWARLNEGVDAVTPEHDNEMLLVRIETLRAIRTEYLARQEAPDRYNNHLMVFDFVAEMIDERATVEALVAEALERPRADD